MTPQDWLMLMCLAVGWVQGVWIGWVLWRRPRLKLKELSNEQD